MQIDRNIWGPETEWITNTVDNNTVTSLRAALGAYMTHQFGDYLASEMTLNALIDNSINFCAAVEDTRDFYKAKSLVFDDNGDILPLYEDAEAINFAWVINPYWAYGNGMSGYIPYWVNDDKNRWSEWASKSAMESADGNFGFQATPIFKQKLNKIIGFIYVCVSTDDTVESGTIEMTLESWISSGHTTRPYLRRVFMQLATCSNPGVTSWNGFCNSIDDYFDITLNLECSSEIKSKGSLKSSYGFYADSSRKQQVTIMGFNNSDYEYVNSGHHPIGVDPDETHYFYNVDHDKVAYIREYSEDLIEEIYHQVAFYGIFFTGAKNYNQTFPLSDNDVYCGTIDENGFTHGEYTRGADNLLQPQFEWEDTEDSPYDPLRPPTPPNNWSTDFPSKYSTYAKYLANHWYLFSDNDLYKFFAEVNNVDLNTLDKNTTYGLNPIDGVLQVKRIFANFTTAKNHLSTTASQYTKIGSLQLDIGSQVANVATFNETYTKDCGTKYAGEIYPDFRTYAPFTSICFYDAFCGVIELQPEKVLNKYISVEQTIDFLLGDKITSVYASPDGSVSKRVRIATLHGNCAEDIPVNGQAVADYQRNKYILTQQKTQQEYTTAGRFAMGVGGATISAVEGNFVGAIAQIIGAGENLGAGITGIKTTEQLLEHTVPSIVRVSQGSANVEDGVIFPPMLIIFPPKMLESYNESDYADKTGFSGYKIDTLANCGVGTHIVSHPRIEISGTSSEMYTIVDQLQKGIYVKPELE